MFPESFTFSIADWVNGWVDALVTNYGDVFRHISDTLLWAIVNLEGLLRAAPWWLMLAIVGGIAWHATRKVVTTAVIVGLLFLVGRGWPVGQADANPGIDDGGHGDLGVDRHPLGHPVGAQ